MAHATHDQVLRQYVQAHNAPCPNCGYDLRGLEGHVCPECGCALRLQIAARSGIHTVTWWVVVLSIALAFMFGLRVLAHLSQPILTYIRYQNVSALVAAGRVSSSQLPDWELIVWMLGWCMACTCLLGIMLGVRHRWPRWSFMLRIPATILAIALPAIFFGLLRWLGG